MADYSAAIRNAANQYGIDPAIYARLIQQESGGDPTIVSPTGAVGLAQLEPATAAMLGVTDSTDPVQNLDGGARFLRQMLDRYGSYPLALAAYNAGPGAVDAYGGIPPYAETQQYVSNILGSNQPAPQPASQPAQQIGSTPVADTTAAPTAAPATQSPVSTLTGDDIVKLLTWLYQQQQQAALAPAQTTGLYPAELTGGQAGTYLPTLTAQEQQATQANAQRQYALDVQRFGLSVAQQAYQQRMGELNALNAEQGPGDWLKYNYTIHNLPYTGTPNPTPQQAPGPSLDLSPYSNWAQQGGQGDGTRNAQFPQYTNAQVQQFEATNPNWLQDMQKANGLATQQAQTAQASQVPQVPSNYSFSNGYGASSQQQFDKMAAQAAQQGGVAGQSQGTNPQQYSGQSALAAATGSGNPALQQALMQAQQNGQYGVPAMAYGGSTVPMLGMGGKANMAVVGDPQQGQRGPNRELAMSAAPITVIPENRMTPTLQRFLESRVTHAATGGTISSSDPYLGGLENGAPAFGASGLGEPWGQGGFSYQNYLKLLPSEQAMLQGYVDSPTQVGGLGGYFPDELQRSRNGAAVGNSFEWFGPAQYGGQ